MSTTHSDMQLREWGGLRIVKFICVAVLLFVHIHLMLITDNFVFADVASFFYKATDRLMVVSLLIYMLPILAGAIFRAELGDVVANGTIKKIDGEKLLRSTVVLLGVGLVMNIATGGILYMFAWNVLQLLAVSFVMIAFLMRITSVYGVMAAGITALLVASPLRGIVAGGGHGYMMSVLIGNERASMFWPLIPWFGVVAFGFLFAHYYIKSGTRATFEWRAMMLGGLLLGIAALRGEIVPQLDEYFAWGGLFSPPLGVVLAALGSFSILIVAVNRLCKGMRIKKYGIINSYSKGILWIYALQMPVSMWLAKTIKHAYPIDRPSVIYLLAVASMLLFGWMIGAASIKLLQEKQIVITIKRMT